MLRGRSPEHRGRWPWLIAALIACAGAGVLIYFWRAARPLWVDEEMLGLNVRDRPFGALGGALWLGQAAPLGWLALERASMLTLGLSERAVRALPVSWALLTLIAVVWVGRRWLGPVGAAVAALLFAFGNHVWFFALELKQYSADTYGGLLLPALAAWTLEKEGEVPDHPGGRLRRADTWWIVAGLMQWVSYGALFATPGCGLALVVWTWRRSGVREASRAAAFAVFWVVCVGLHYYLSIRHASGSAYLQSYWATAFPPVPASASATFHWLTERFQSLSEIPGGTKYSISFWLIAIAGLVIGVRERPTLGWMLATVAPSALVLAVFRFVPLSGRLSLWVLPSLYLGIAMAGDRVVREVQSSLATRRWLVTAAAVVCGLFVVRLSADIYRVGAMDIKNRPKSTHSLDDRGAIRSLMAQRHPGDAMLATHLGLPAIWWYGNVNISDTAEGASFADGGPIFEIWHGGPGMRCAPGDLGRALSDVNAVAVYLGFDLQDHILDIALNRLAEMGAVTFYRRFAESGHTAIIDLRRPPTGRILVPSARPTDPRVLEEGCITIKRAHRW